MTTSSPDEDAMIERLDAGEPPSSPEEAQARAPYERVIERVRDLQDIAPRAGWENRAFQRWSGARRKRRIRGAAIATAAAVAALAAIVLWHPCAASRSGGLEVAVLTPAGSTRRGDAAVGDVLRARAPLGAAQVELRVYLGTTLVARCPGSAQCRGDASAIEIDWKTTERGDYQIVMLSSASSIPAGGGILERDLLDARTTGANPVLQSVKVAP
ncbi:MAG TPA: hypothetical protein VFT22_06560 [Kofleriaceae bacterium]|nr:hypothetical protein [Kofleriaceae bacterium]